MYYIKKAEEFLNDYKNLLSKLDSLKKKISEINTGLYEKNTNYFSEPAGSVLLNESLLNKLQKKKNIEKNIQMDLRKVNRIDDILDKLGKLNKNDEKILRLFYIEGIKNVELERSMGCSIRHAFRLKKRAIQRLSIQLFGVNALYELSRERHCQS